MMRDFTLIIPTHNRPRLFAGLLGYLETERADCPILVLDSSDPEAVAANRDRVAACSLPVEFLELTNVDSEQKWHEGIQRVTTPFCALCADDDLVILNGVRRCLEVLRNNPAAAVVQGYSFTFLPRAGGDMELNNVVYFSRSIEDKSPLNRLNSLFGQYQALTYGTFRTPVLQRIYNECRPVKSNLLRELLWSALTVLEGQAVRVPVFSHGRSMGRSGNCEHWHPLEWLCKDPESLLADYLQYREILAAALEGQNELTDVIDLIHLRYLTKHAPDAALEFITQQQIAGVEFASYWPAAEIHLPLYETAGVTPSELASALPPLTVQGRCRSYIVFPSFYASAGAGPVVIDKMVGLIEVLDSYRLPQENLRPN
jgi:glycosyltransferase domain-containing protein